MKVYIIVRTIDGETENVIVTSSKKVAEHLCSKFNVVDNYYYVEEHELMGESMMDGN